MDPSRRPFPYPPGAWGVGIPAFVLAAAALYFFLAAGDVVGQTALGKGLPAFSDETWNACWLLGGSFTFAGCLRQRRWASAEAFGLFLSSFAAAVYSVALAVTVIQGEPKGLIACVLAAQSTTFMGWRLRYLLRHIRER